VHKENKKSLTMTNSRIIDFFRIALITK